MKINLAKSAGFCFGVKRAIKTAFAAAFSGETIEMLGDIVHNEDAVDKIKKAGIKKISLLKNGKNKTLLIRAHGAPLDIFIKARALGYKIIDATCPMVKEIHKIVVAQQTRGRNIIIVGDKEHDEVKGIMGQINHRAIVIDALENIPFAEIKKIKKACLVVQSTQNLEKVLKIAEVLKQYITDLSFFNTICNPTRTKQQEIRAMPLENDVIIVIGSRTSANTRRLYEISKSLNARTHWIQSDKEIKPSWFKGAESVGVTAGASTPDEVTKEIVEKLNNLG
jgi:4-hydroxy-3-methylbut-2-enyl diphosphate reductase